ncbi:MAG: cell division protein CrgA [Planctomycetota bacterium]|jgi:hypothetical protein
MEDISNVSSEEELLQLRNEGKISEAEYRELRNAMQTTKKADAEPPAPKIEKAKSKRKLGKVAFALMLVGVILPVVLYWSAETAAQIHDPNMHVGIGGYRFYLGVLLEIAAFVIGVIAWPDVFAKATVVTISLIIVLLFLFMT